MPEADAELARSILASPDSAELAVDGHPDVACDDDLGLREDDGGAELAWLYTVGSHRSALWFSRPARTVEELALLLRHELHAGIC